MSGIQASKALLRKEIKQKILKLSTEEKKRQSDFVYRKLINLPVFKNSERISVYLSTENEISTELIVKKIFDLDKICFVPRYEGDIMQMVKLHSMQDWSQLPLTKWKIKQPDLKEYRDNALDSGGLDLIIVPGVGFTKDGMRLGHGKGYYDSFFSEIFKLQDNRPTTIGLAFKQQIMESIPCNKHDVKLDVVLHPCD